MDFAKSSAAIYPKYGLTFVSAVDFRLVSERFVEVVDLRVLAAVQAWLTRTPFYHASVSVIGRDPTFWLDKTCIDQTFIS